MKTMNPKHNETTEEENIWWQFVKLYLIAAIFAAGVVSTLLYLGA